MKTIFTILAIVIFTTTYAQDNSVELFHYNAAKTDNPIADFKRVVDDAVILNINSEVLRTIFDSRDNVLNLRIPVSKTQSVNVRLERFEVLAPDARIVEKSLNGEREVDLRNVVLSYKGKVSGAHNSMVSITFYNDKVIGLMKSEKETYVLGALKDANNNETEDYILFQNSKMKSRNNFKCGSEIFDVPNDVLKKMREFKNQTSDNTTTNLLEAKIAIDVDYFTHNAYGGTANATAYALAIMSASSAVYIKDMNIKLTVGYLRIWTIQDPYTSPDGFVLLDQFRVEWATNQGSVQRVVAHLLTRRSLNVGGIAYLNVLCNTGFGYGLSALTGVINPLPAYSYDVVVVTHELGHNFGSPHTHNCGWVNGPIDTCYILEGGCTGTPHPSVGTIMSYCDTEGGTVIMDFGPQPEALIRNSAEAAVCITVYDRPILTAYPNGGETFRTLANAKIYWGSSNTGDVNLEYTTNNGASWITVQNNVPAQQREFNWTIPYIGYTNQAKVRVLNSSNPAEGDTSDATFRIILSYNAFSVLSPPNFARIETNSSNTSIQQFVWGSSGSHPSLRYKLKIRKIGAGGVDHIYNSDNGGTDTAVSFRKSFLDSLAQTLGTIGDSVRCTWRAWTYNGVDSATAQNTFVVTFVRVTVGINIISSEVPERFNLENNYPNPFNPSTVIKFDVAITEDVNITIYDMLGRKVENLVNEKLQPGKYEVTFNAANYSSGIYYYRMESKEFIQTKKMLLVK